MPNRHLVTWAVIATFALALLALSLGCLGLALLTTLSRAIEVEQRELSAIVMTCAGLLGLGLATVLLLSGFEAWLARPSPLLYPQRAWITLLAATGVSGIGGAMLATAGRFTVVIAPFHLALIVLPALLFCAVALLMAGRGAVVTRRQAVLVFMGGAFSTLPAILVEMFGFVFSALLVMVGAVFVPGGQAELTRLTTELQQWSQLAPEAINSDMLTSLLASPVVLAVLLLTLAVIAPLVEEVLKTAVLVVIGFRKRPQPLQAFLWGMVAGIGFAVIEGVFNSSASLTDAMSWAVGIGSRIPATAMHAFASGLIGLGWGYFWQGRSRWVLPLCYAAAIFLHGLWNFSVVAVAGAAAWLTLPGWLSGAVSVLGVVIVGGLAIVAVIGIIGIPLLLRQRPAPA